MQQYPQYCLMACVRVCAAAFLGVIHSFHAPVWLEAELYL